ncbi:MAG: hypothetical protein KIT62_11210 [Cyclobacteriaceae bacterium]|nr:hypothetical protein [Cyclobacteriaceae bacterium]
MKRFLRLLSFFMAVAAVTLVQSCKEDDPEPAAAPTVTLSATAATGTPGSTVPVTVTIQAGNGAKTLTVTGAASTPASPITISGTSATQDITLTIPANAVVGSTITAVIIATDNENMASAPATFTITVGDPVITLQGNLTTQTLDASKVYLLKSQVFIPDGVTLTIPAGTVIKGEKATKAALIVRPGGKLVANGTASNPVVFTSNQGVGERDKGDWAGIVVLGKAFVNQPGLVAIEGISPAVNYGVKYQSADAVATPATNADDNSGVLKYVRIEYAGIELTPNNETNSLTMGGVGNGTEIDYVQVSYGGDDGFEWFGGTVNGKHLISQATWDDDFDTDFGWSGKVQFGLIVRYPFAADQSESNAFESDNQGNGNALAGICDDVTRAGCTSGVFSNITVLGPRDITSRSISGNYRNALHIRRRSSISIFNSYFSGFRIGLRIDDAGTLGNITSGNAVWENNILVVPGNLSSGVLGAIGGNALGASISGTTPSDAAFATGLSLTDAGSTTSGTAGNATFIGATWDAANDVVLAPPTVGWTADTNPYAGFGIGHDWYWRNSGTAAYTAPNFTVTTGTLASGADFSHAKLTGDFFETTGTFRGAFGATNWTTGWAEFQPQSKTY